MSDESGMEKFIKGDNSESNTSPVVMTITLLTACVALIILVTGDWFEAGPFLLGTVITILLWPFRAISGIKAIYYAVGFLLIVYIVRELQVVLVPFVVSFIVAYLVAPIMDFFRRNKIPSGVAAFLVTGIFVAVMVMIVFGLGPLLGSQIQLLYKQINQWFLLIPSWLNQQDVRTIFMSLGIDPVQLKNQMVSNLYPEVKAFILAHIGMMNDLVSMMGMLVNILVSLLLIPFLLFYFLKDYQELANKFKGLIPDEKRISYSTHSRKLQKIISTYVRGQLLIAFIGSLIVLIALLINQVEFAVTLAVFYMFLSLIPYIGVFIMIVFGVIISSSAPDFLTMVIIITSTFLITAGIQTFILTPKILGDQVGLHPVILILSISIFGYFLGILGMLIAIPLTAAINVYLRDWLDEKNLQYSWNQMEKDNEP